MEEALDIRRRILLAFEAAERETDPEERRAWMTFVVVGGGPTGVELAGALGEMAHSTLKNDFRHINPATARILLIEGTDRILPGVAPVAMQQGRYVAKLIQKRLEGQSLPAFRYRDKGSLAVIGRNAAVVELGALRLSGFPAWIIWVFVHIAFLIEFDNRGKRCISPASLFFQKKNAFLMKAATVTM